MKKATKMVYCGPTLPGVAKQYTVYTGGIPAALKEAAKKMPPLSGLIVPLDELPEVMRSLREGSGSIYALYQSAAGK